MSQKEALQKVYLTLHRHQEHSPYPETSPETTRNDLHDSRTLQRRHGRTAHPHVTSRGSRGTSEEQGEDASPPPRFFMPQEH
ncbi:hypothetical protein E2C01_040824 [Portunus trituberculatus]|uniref:Uncharacterized protein n=1 Tax=Portunus trituberculatus TaxID=210409 RepID=A0A5B7FP92_PORTR|nr:hypothetical protein [Portunus trituberculatus]